MTGTSAYPIALDTFNNPGPGNSTDDAGYYLDVEISKLNDAMGSIEAEVGINGSIVSTTLDYILKNHTHQGTDNSTKIGLLVAQSVVDGNILSLKNAAGTNLVGASTSTTAPYGFSVVAPGLATVAMAVLASQGGSPTGDLLQLWNGSGQVVTGVKAGGDIYSIAALTLQKGIGGLNYLSTQPTLGEIDLPNGTLVKGWSGAVGTGQQSQLDNSQGLLQLGGPSGSAALVLNAFKVNRTSQMSLIGKDNSDVGTTNFNLLVDSDGQIAPQARSFLLNGQVANHTTGVSLAADTFLSATYPTYDGVSTYTKAVGISVTPGVAPTSTAGYLSVTGSLAVSGGTLIGGAASVTGALGVTGALTASGGILAAAQRIQNVAAPVTGTDAANSTYVTSTIASQVAVGGYTAATLGGTWTNYTTAGFGNAGYLKDATGYVHMMGLASPGTTALVAGTAYTVCTLPAGYRPLTVKSFWQAFNGATPGNFQGAMVQVYTTGVVSVISPIAVAASSTFSFISFDGILFSTTG